MVKVGGGRIGKFTIASARDGLPSMTANGGPPLNSEQVITEFEALRQRGARYLVFTRYTVWWLLQRFSEISRFPLRACKKTDDYVIFDLAGKPNEGAASAVAPTAAPPARSTAPF
jgi:hypothetical protein